MRQRTKEERFILCCYAKTEQTGDEEMEFESSVIAAEVGIGSRAIDNIVKRLQRGNFIKKTEATQFKLTAHGRAVAKQILEEQ